MVILNLETVFLSLSDDMRRINSLIMVALLSATVISCQERIVLEKVNDNGVVFQKKASGELRILVILTGHV